MRYQRLETKPLPAHPAFANMREAELAAYYSAVGQLWRVLVREKIDLDRNDTDENRFKVRNGNR